MKLHLDTDLGGDMDDLCALAMLLCWPGLEITGITTNAEENGRRAGYVRYILNLVGRGDIPVAAGADLSDGHYRYDKLGYPPDEENWPEPIPLKPGDRDEATVLLKQSVDQGALVVGIGPLTNLARLDEVYPGTLHQADLYIMGSYAYDIPPEYPQFKREDDWNIQFDIQASRYLLENTDPTLIPLTVSCQTFLRRADLPRLAGAGKLGQLLVRQAEVFARHEDLLQRYGTYSGVPRDIINFHHDPLACAIALGWRDGIEMQTVPLKVEEREGWLYEKVADDGIQTRLVTKIDGEAFSNHWLNVICGTI